jgi:AraC-like DNA-binding protein
MHNSPWPLHEAPTAPASILVAAPCVASAGAHSAPAGRDYPLHQHPDLWELVYYREGNIACYAGDTWYQVHPGMLVLNAPQTPHCERALTAYANFHISLSTPRPLDWPRCCSDDAHGTLEHICAALVREWNGREADREAMIESLARQLDIAMRRAGGAAALSQDERMVRSAEACMAQRFNGRCTIAGVARSVGVAPSVLRAHFVRLRGQRPIDYLHGLRLQHATGLLRDSSLTLEAVAKYSGFHSASHLSRHVKRATGKSPGALRELQRIVSD